MMTKPQGWTVDGLVSSASDTHEKKIPRTMPRRHPGNCRVRLAFQLDSPWNPEVDLDDVLPAEDFVQRPSYCPVSEDRYR